MARQNVTRMTVRVHSTGTREYRGTRAELLNAGIVTADQLPGEPECTRKATYRTPPADDGSCIIVNRKGPRFEVLWYPSDDTVASLLNHERARVEFDKEMRLMPSSPEHYRECAVEWARAMLGAHVDSLSTAAKWHGYQFAEASLNEIREAADALILTLLAGKVTFDRRLREARLQDLRARVARTDPGLQSFLGYATATMSGMSAEEAGK